MKTLLYLTIIGVLSTPIAMANNSVFSEQQISEKIHALSSKKTEINNFKSLREIQSALEELDEADQIVLIHQWIKTLSDSVRIDDIHRQWLVNLASSDLKLVGFFNEHPESEVNFIDLAQSAKAALKLLRVKTFESELTAKWKQGNIRWSNWLEKGTDKYSALIQWLKKRDAQQAKEIGWQWLDADQIATLPDNQSLTILLSKHYADDLLKQLVQKKADEFSYQYFQRLPDLVEPPLAVDQLDLALDNPDLASQVILSLASHYSHNDAAQTLLAKALDKPSQQWFAVAALEKVEDDRFRNILLKRFENDASALAKVATRQLKKGASL